MKETTKRLLRDVTKIAQKMQLCLKLCVAKSLYKKKAFLTEETKKWPGKKGKNEMSD